MIIHTLPLGSYQTNCYIVHKENAKSCAIIDPGYQGEQVIAYAQKLGLAIDAVLLTHGHFDHVGAVLDITKATNCAIWMNQGDYSPEKHPLRTMFYPLADLCSPVIQLCEEGEHIHAGGLTFTVMETPGHTWGSVCYLCEDAIFSGDTLFAGSCGRTDLPGGDWNTIQDSLSRLGELEGDFTIYPGHGESSTLEYERKNNPYLR